MTQVILVKPTIDLKKEYIAFYHAWLASGENMVPWVISKDPTDFEEMIRFLENTANGTGLPDGWVASSTYWLITSEKIIVGAVNIRHSLTKVLFECGGHIGYGIRPSARKKGYATQLLALSLEKARELAIEKVLVVCDESNIASEKSILKNGGLQDTNFIEEDGNVVKRFWINL